MFGSGSDQPQITGQWQYGSDTSTHKIGLAPTDRNGVFALGSEQSRNPEFVTADQISRLATDVTAGKYDNLLAK